MQPYPFSCCSVVLSFRSRGSLQLRKAIGLGHKQVKMVRTSVTVSFIINTVYSWFESFWSKEKFSKKGQSVYSCSSKALLISQVLHHHHLIIYPLTARVVGAPQMILQPVSSIFPCSPLPFRTVHSLMLSWWRQHQGMDISQILPNSKNKNNTCLHMPWIKPVPCEKCVLTPIDNAILTSNVPQWLGSKNTGFTFMHHREAVWPLKPS